MYDMYMQKGDISTPVSILFIWIVNFKFFYLKSENWGIWDAFSSNALFSEMNNIIQTAKKVSAVYRESTIAESTVGNCFC